MTVSQAGEAAPTRPGRTSGHDLAALWRSLGHPGNRSWLLGHVAAIVVVIAANAWGQVRLNTWQGDFFDAIGRRDLPGFLAQLLVFAQVVAGLLALVVLQTWLAEHFKIRLRDALTGTLLARWLSGHRAYLLQYLGPACEHPDQRIHEDSRHLAELASDLGVGLIQSTLLLASFVGVLWQLSADMAVTVAGRTLTVPGFLVWAALSYALAGSLLTSWVGRPLIALNDRRYASEGELRFALVRIDESAQSIALDRREEEELATARQAFGTVQAISRRLANALSRLTLITSAYGWGTLVAPAIAAMPAYFSGSLSLGGLMMAIGAFGQVQQALRWFVDNFSRIADARATLGRVMALAEALDDLSRGNDDPHITVEPSDDGALHVEGLRLDLPDGSAALDEDPLVVAPGDRVLVVGEPGSGKSLLFLALAGLWSRGRGTIRTPQKQAVLFLPERPHLGRAALRDILAPPGSPVSDAEILGALERVGLSHLRAHLDRVARWDRELHFDEQQDAALVRLLLLRPAWVIMDAALSALGDARRAARLALLARELPGTTFVGTGVRSEADGFWTRSVRLRRAPAPTMPPPGSTRAGSPPVRRTAPP